VTDRSQSQRARRRIGLSSLVFVLLLPAVSASAGHKPSQEPTAGSLVKANRDGTFTEILNGLDQPTSLEIIGNSAYVIDLPGEIWKIRLPGG
jgi:hypothetical protein